MYSDERVDGEVVGWWSLDVRVCPSPCNGCLKVHRKT